jgi:hypothetical protein
LARFAQAPLALQVPKPVSRPSLHSWRPQLSPVFFRQVPPSQEPVLPHWPLGAAGQAVAQQMPITQFPFAHSEEALQPWPSRFLQVAFPPLTHIPASLQTCG